MVLQAFLQRVRVVANHNFWAHRLLLLWVAVAAALMKQALRTEQMGEVAAGVAALVVVREVVAQHQAAIHLPAEME
jgi:hypothetical protein